MFVGLQTPRDVFILRRSKREILEARRLGFLSPSQLQLIRCKMMIRCLKYFVIYHTLTVPRERRFPISYQSRMKVFACQPL